MDFSWLSLFQFFADLLLHLDVYLANAVQQYGTWIYVVLFLVIFCETGLVIMPFLPGDSLLFVAGAVAATGGLDPILISLVLMSAAILGDSTNYVIGRRIGKQLFHNEKSKIFQKKHFDQAHAFFEKHGGKTVAIARFLPIFRTFTPFVAGMAKMAYSRFLLFSVTGTLVWVGSLVAAGYWFGNIPLIKNNLSLIVLVVIVISLLPLLWQFAKLRLSQRAAA